MSTLKLNALLEAVAKGDALALGELPNALVGKSAAEIDCFARDLRPLLKDTDLMTMAESIIADAHKEAVRRRPVFQKKHPLDRTPIVQPPDPFGGPFGQMILRSHQELAALSRRKERDMPPVDRTATRPRAGSTVSGVNMDLQPGQQYFEVDGERIPAGSYKAAVKKAKKLKAQLR